MATPLSAQDKQFVQTGSIMAVVAYGDTPLGDTPLGTGWKVLQDENGIDMINNANSGFQAQAYINTTTKQVWVAVAGTNDGQDRSAWSSAVIGWNAGASQFKDGINFAAQVNNVVKNNPQYTGYSMSTSGHSFGEGFAQMFSYIFGWGGVGYDGIGAGAIIGSAGFNQYLASQNITAVGGKNFISCNTSGLFNISGLLAPGGGLVGSIGSDIPGARQCTVNVEGGWFSGLMNLALGYLAGPIGYAGGKLVSGGSLHSMETEINPAIQKGNFTVDAPTQQSPNPLTYNDFMALDNAMVNLYGAGVVDPTFYNNYNDFASFLLLNTAPTQQIGPFVPGYNPADPYGLNLDPIGAFYESVTPALDLAPSIADKTPVLLGANNSGLSVSALTTRDANLDGKLTGTELTGLNVWVDANENGLLDTGELRSLATAGISQIKSADYGFYTQGNAVIGTGVAVTPVRPNELSGVPVAIAAASNYRALRDTDNIYIVSASPLTYFAWNANQIKINNSNRSYLIGTDGADNFDASTFQQTYNSQYFNYSLLTNFFAGGGDDVFGGLGNDCEAANDEMFEMRRMG